jgi:hypothetical protein
VLLDFLFLAKPVMGRTDKQKSVLAHDPFEAKLADGFKHPVAMTFGVFDVLNAVRTKQEFAER